LVAAVAFIGRGSAPLYFKAFAHALSGDDVARLQLVVYSALDVIGERVREERPPPPVPKPGMPPPPSAPPMDQFLGLLSVVDDYKVFGGVDNGNVKCVVVMRDVLLREDVLKDLFRRLHTLYTDACSNPFAPIDGSVSSPAFEEGLYRLVDAATPVLEYRGAMAF
jgi:hypothetical protein